MRSKFPSRFPTATDKSANVFWQLFMLTPHALDAQVYFSGKGIDVASSSLELVSSLNEYPGKIDLPLAQSFYSNGIFIPCFPWLHDSDIDRVIEALENYFDSHLSEKDIQGKI